MSTTFFQILYGRITNDYLIVENFFYPLKSFLKDLK